MVKPSLRQEHIEQATESGKREGKPWAIFIKERGFRGGKYVVVPYDYFLQLFDLYTVWREDTA